MNPDEPRAIIRGRLEETGSIDEQGLPIYFIRVYNPRVDRYITYTCFAEDLEED